MSVLVDTNVLSELIRAEPAAAVRSWMFAQRVETLHVSAITQAEMLLGARLLPAGRRRSKLEQSLYEMFDEAFANRIVPFDHRAAPYFAGVVAARRSAGRPISQFDAQIAAIALANGMSLATRNVADFVACGLELVNPWD